MLVDGGFPKGCTPPYISVRYNSSVRGSEFLRAVKAYARKKGINCRWAPQRGSGSYGTLYLGSSLTVVKDLRKELGPGLLAAMCKQIGIRKEDL